MSTQPEPDVQASIDDVFHILSNSRRRWTIEHIATLDESESLNLRELSKHIAGIETDKQPANVSNKEYKRVYVSLKQTHLEKLAEVDAVEYDGYKIKSGENAPALAYWLTVLRQGVDS